MALTRDALQGVANCVSMFAIAPTGRLPHCMIFYTTKEKHMSIGTILLIVLVLLLVGAIPTWPHSRSWGYAPSGVLGLVVIVLLIMVLTGRL